MALSKNTPLAQVLGEINSIPIVDDDIVYEGAMVGLVAASGHGEPLGVTVGGTFMGHCVEKVDNTLTDHSAGGKDIKLLSGRYKLEVTLSGVARTDIGAGVWAGADDVVGLTHAGDEVVVGVVIRYVKADTCVVEFRTTP